MKHAFLIIALFVFWSGVVMPQSGKAQDRALPVSEDLQTLYRRALSRPGAELLDAPDGEMLRELPPFQVFYIYDQTPEWTKVGSAVEGAVEGFIATDAVLDWNTNIVATFNNQASARRERHMIFDTRESLVDLLGQEDIAAAATAYRDRAAAGQPLEGSGVIALEPVDYIDLRNRFYIMPILEAKKNVRLPGRNRGNLVQIAAMSATKSAPPDDNTAPDLSQMPVEIVFVIDTTRSMQPFIDETTETIRAFGQQIADAGYSDNLRFGIVEFRDNVALAPKLEYATRIALPLSEQSDATAFLEAMESVEATQANSDGYNEDAIAGLHQAITNMNWSEAGAKFIYLVTDAGPRIEDGTLADLQLDEVRNLASEKGIAIFTWHLLTSGGTFDHAAARDDYTALSQFNDIGAYFGIDQGDPVAFSQILEDNINNFATILEGAQQGLLATEVDDETMDDSVAQIGLAMQLAYLGQINGTAVPDVFAGWTVDRGIIAFDKPALEIRIMLTKNELSTMSRVVSTMVQEMTDGVLDPTTFFEQMQGAMALLSQDSSRVASLDVLGNAVAAYLADLPYQSAIMNLTEEDWIALGGGGQQALKNELRSKLRIYEDIYADPTLWTALDDDAPEGEHVSLILLDLMP